MRIDIFSDYVCPFCTLGERHLELALEDFAGAGDVQVTWRSFQLDPDAPQMPEKKAPEYLAAKKGMTPEQVAEMNDGLAERARGVGLEFNWRDAYMVNTFDIHRLSHYARIEGLANDFERAVKKGYFTDGKIISDPDTLRGFAAEVGLDDRRVEEVLGSDEFATDVVQELALARQLGVQGVPFFIFEGKFAVTGAQPVEVFTQALEKTAAEPAGEAGPVLPGS